MIYLIDFEDITEGTPLGGNIDIDRYKFCIQDAQNSKMRELLGDTLYNKVETDYFNNALAGNYLELYNSFVKPILIHQTAVEYLTVGSFQVSNGGIFKHTPANGTPVEMSDLKYLIDSQKLKVEMYVERLNRWLLRVYPSEYTYHYENIVNPSFRSRTGLNFDFIGNKTSKVWNEKPDNRMSDF